MLKTQQALDPLVSTQQAVDTTVYPEADGKVSESDEHVQQSIYLISALGLFFAGRSDVFVGGNLFVYYQQGDKNKSVSPDVMVVFGARPHPARHRGSYKMWEEGVPPTVVIELTSEGTAEEDRETKPAIYAALGVREYYLFDPLDQYLQPRLQGYQLNAQGLYERMPGEEPYSLVLGLRLRLRDDWLRLFDPVTGTLLPTLKEADAARRTAEARSAQEHAARRAAEARSAQEHAARLAAEAELARLRAELARRPLPET